MSQHHAAIKNDPRWHAARAACLDRDDHACVWCGREENLEADHILEVSTHPDLAFEVENLRTLCRPCHTDRHRRAGGEALVRAEWINPRYADTLAAIL